MIKKLIIGLVIIMLMVLIISCTANDIDEDNELISLAETDERENKGLEQISDGYILRENRSHNIEFHLDKIYALYTWRNPDNDNDWTEALWCFSPSEDAKLITEGKGLNFRVSKNNEYIATEMDGDIEFYNKDGKLLHVISNEAINTEEYTKVQLEQWNNNGDVLWCSLMETYNTIAYVKIDTETWEFVKYNDLNFFSEEYVLNPNTGWIVYSDYPVLLEIISSEEYMESNRITTLSIYNLMTKEEIEVEASETNRFKPKWSNDNEVLYYIRDKVFFYKLDEK